MGFENFTYLLLLAGVIMISVLTGIKTTVHFYSKLKYLVPAIVFSGIIFILWDIRFTEIGIWNFNPEYVSGFYILKLPVEEWLYFIVIPASFIYVFELFKIRFSGFEKPNLFVVISLILLVVFALIAYFGRQKLYTFFTFFLLSIYFGYTIFRNRFKPHYTKFYLTFIISLIVYLPLSFLLTKLPVLEYNNSQILGIRIFSIPVENLARYFLLVLINTTIYEYLKQQRLY